jgi:hypothetical protein
MTFDPRSDTVTRSTPAMAAAEVGDDVFGDDPSVNPLRAAGVQCTGTARPHRATRQHTSADGMATGMRALRATL